MFKVQCTWCGRFWMHSTCLLSSSQLNTKKMIICCVLVVNSLKNLFISDQLSLWVPSTSKNSGHVVIVETWMRGTSVQRRLMWCVMVMIWPTTTFIDTRIPRENTANKLKITSFVGRGMVFESGMQIGQLLVCCISCNERMTRTIMPESYRNYVSWLRCNASGKGENGTLDWKQVKSITL